jgi:hypothetical protein
MKINNPILVIRIKKKFKNTILNNLDKFLKYFGDANITAKYGLF